MALGPINDNQRRVLDWLSAGGLQDQLTPQMKISAAALKNRGLVQIRRSRGKWTADLTDAGRYYHQHGDYPPKAERPTKQPGTKPRRPPTTPKLKQAAPVQEAGPDEAARVAEEAAAELPLRQVVRRPHPAVRELRDRPGRLPKFAQRRCVLIVHSLVAEALDRGWKVTAVVGTVHQDRWSGRATRYDKQSLLLIDAGHAPVGLIFDEVTKRQPHEDTPEDAADRAAGRYVFAPRYDYIGTGRLRLHLTQQDRKTSRKFVDGARRTIEDQLGDVMDGIESATKQALHWAEQRRIREEEEAARRREAQRISDLRHAYERWESRLHERADAWARHRDLAAFLDVVAVDADDPARVFVAWAHGLLAATDPRLGFPNEDLPQWTHQERAEWGRPEPRPKYSWMQ